MEHIPSPAKFSPFLIDWTGPSNLNVQELNGRSQISSRQEEVELMTAHRWAPPLLQMPEREMGKGHPSRGNESMGHGHETTMKPLIYDDPTRL